MKGILKDKVLKQDRFKLERTCSKYKEVDEYNNHHQHYFKASVGPYKKFFVNGSHTRMEAYNACVAFAERNGYTLTAR